MRLNCVCSCSSARGRRSGPGGWPGRSSRFLYQSQGCKEGRDCGGSHEPLNVTEAGLLTVIEGCTAEQLKLGGGLCPLVIGGRVQKLRPDQQRPLRAPHQRGQVIRTEWGQVLRSTWCWCCTSSSTACTRGRSPPPLRPTVILVAGAGQLATTSQLSLGLAAAASPALQPSTRFHHQQLGLQDLDTSVEVSLSSHLWLQLLVEDATTISSDRSITMPRGGRSKT